MIALTVPPATVDAAVRPCPHTPMCPPATAANRDAARVVTAHPDQGWELLCNGVVRFADTGELLPDGRAIDPHRPKPPHSDTRLPDPSGGLFPTRTRLVLLRAIAAGGVVNRTRGQDADIVDDIDLCHNTRVTSAVKEQRRAGWVRLQPRTWATGEANTTWRYWEATLDGKAMLRRAGIHVPIHWTTRAPVELAAAVNRIATNHYSAQHLGD